MGITENKLQLCLAAFSFKGAISQYPYSARVPPNQPASTCSDRRCRCSDARWRHVRLLRRRFKESLIESLEAFVR